MRPALHVRSMGAAAKSRSVIPEGAEVARHRFRPCGGEAVMRPFPPLFTGDDSGGTKDLRVMGERRLRDVQAI